MLAYSSDPKNFVKELVNEAISKLSDTNFTKNEKSKFIEKIALENVDINALGLYTLGELRKSSNELAISKYQQAFEKYDGLRLLLDVQVTTHYLTFTLITKINANTDLPST